MILQAINKMNEKMEANMKEEIKNNAKQMEEKMEGNTKKMEANIKEDMKDEMKKMRGEMRQIGRGLQAGTARIVAVARGEARTTAGKMATPRATTNELEGSAPAGEDRVSRGTCGARRVEVTEKVTVTVTKWEKLIRVTETCTRVPFDGGVASSMALCGV